MASCVDVAMPALVKQKLLGDGPKIVEEIGGAFLFSASVHLLLVVVLFKCSANLIFKIVRSD